MKLRKLDVALPLLLAIATPAAADDTAPGVVDKLAAATNQRGGLTADTVAASAVATSPGLAAQRAELSAASAAVDQALAAYAPHLTLSARRTRLSKITPPALGDIVLAPGGPGPVGPGTPLVSVPLSFPSLTDQTVLEAELDVPVSDYFLRLNHQLAAARHSADAAVLGEVNARRQTAADARIAYYSWARARLEVIVATEAVHQAELHLGDVQRLAAADRANKADVLRVESQRASAEQLRVRAENASRVAEQQVRILLRTPSSELTIGEALNTDYVLTPPGDADALVAQALADRPEMRALSAEAGSITEQSLATTGAALPRLDLVGDVTSADPNQRYLPPADEYHTTWAVGAQLTWQLGDAPAHLAAARSLRAHAAGVVEQRAALADAIRLDVTRATSAVTDAISAQQTSARELAAAEESYRVRHALFLDGRATSTELTDAETELTRARFDAVDARIDARIAAVRLSFALGRDAR